MKKIYLFAVIFALIAGFATFFFVNSLQHNSALTGVEEADVVVAMQDIEPDTVAKPEMFQTIRVPVSAITYGTLVNAEDANGLVVTQKILKGEQVLASKLAQMGEGTDGRSYNGEYRLSYHLEKGSYAYTFKADEADAVAYFIKKGDYINIYDSTESGPVLKNVKVLQIGTYSDEKLSNDGTETTTYALFTVSLSEKQIEKIMKFDDAHSNTDTFHVVLVPYAEGADIKTTKKNNDTNAQAKEPATNYGMGEITTTAPETTKAK